MPSRDKKIIIRSIITLMFFFANGLVFSDESENSQLSVRGEAVLMVEPDQVAITIDVITEAEKVKIALRENSKKMQAAIALLKGLGLTEDDYQTQNFSINPRWSNRISGNNNQREIEGYMVNNRLRLTTTRLDDIGEIIAAVASQGVNQIQSIVFNLKNPRLYREQAITAASNNAKIDAEALAKANGVRLIKIKSLQLDNASASVSQVPKAMVMESRSMAADVAPPIEAGDIAVRASVSAIYEIDGNL